MSGSAVRSKRQQPHKPALQPAARRTQPLRMRQRHAVHCRAGEGAGHTRRKAWWTKGNRATPCGLHDCSQTSMPCNNLSTSVSGSASAVTCNDAGASSSLTSSSRCLLTAPPLALPLIFSSAMRCKRAKYCNFICWRKLLFWEASNMERNSSTCHRCARPACTIPLE